MRALMMTAALAVTGMAAQAVPAPLYNEQGQRLLYQYTALGYRDGAINFEFRVRNNGEELPGTISYNPGGPVYEDGIARESTFFYSTLFSQFRSSSFNFVLNEDRSSVLSGSVTGNLYDGRLIYSLGTGTDLYIRFGDASLMPSGAFYVSERIVYTPLPASAAGLLFGLMALAAAGIRSRQVR